MHQAQFGERSSLSTSATIAASDVSYDDTMTMRDRPCTMQDITDEVRQDLGQLRSRADEVRQDLGQLHSRADEVRQGLGQLRLRVDNAGMGDLAYWYRRAQDLPRVPTGTILQLADPAQHDGRAELVRDDAPGSSRFVVVSDDVALFKGGINPHEEEELEGKWVVKIGEVDVMVRGQVKVGDWVGPLGDGSGIGEVKAGAVHGE